MYPTILNNALKPCTGSSDLMQPFKIISPGFKTSGFVLTVILTCCQDPERLIIREGEGVMMTSSRTPSFRHSPQAVYFIAALNINVSTFVNSIAL